MKDGWFTYGFAAIVLGIVGILVVPLPPVVLDALLAFNIMGSGIVLLLAITLGDPLEFAAFAPALLIATLFRLSLDVSATRLILTQGTSRAASERSSRRSASSSCTVISSSGSSSSQS